MSTPLDIACPCCGDHDTPRLGKLPDSSWFAGKRLEQTIAGGNLYRCRSCLLKFRHPVLDPAIYQLLYDNAAVATWPAETARPDWNLITDHIREQLPHGGRVLDFGCYSGGLLARLGAAYERYGVEINQAAAVVASQKAHAQVWPSVEDIPALLRFDAVIVADVIEHTANPAELVEKLKPLLADRGSLIITTGDADNFLWNRFGANWWYCFYPEHIAFISKAWLDFACSATGLSLVHCETFRYREQSVAHSVINTMFAYCYGLFPAIYLCLGGFLKRILGRPGMTSVPGNGVSADHLFIVLEVEQ